MLDSKPPQPMSRLSSALLLSMITTSSGAQLPDSQDYLTETDLSGLAVVINSVTHLPQKRSEAPAAVTVLDRRLIAASGAITLVEVLRLVPGFQAYYINGNNYGTNYHALGDSQPRRMEVKVDGRSVYESLLSAVEWQSLGIEMQDIDYIEVVRGPNQSADGSNAFLGTINIVTSSPVANEGGAVRTTLGYANTRRLSARYNTTLGEVHNRFTASYEKNDGFPDLPEEPINDSLTIANLGYRGVWTPNLKDVVDFQLGYSNSDNGVGGSGGSPDEVRPREYHYNYQSLSWLRDHDRINNFELVFYHNYLSLEEQEQTLGTLAEELGFPPELVPIAFPGFEDFQLPPLQLKGRSQRFDLEFRHILDFNALFRMNWGAAARYDRASSEYVFDSNDWLGQTQFRLFTNLEGRPTRWLTLNLGLMTEHNDRVGGFVSPRFSTNFHITSENTIRLLASRGYRSPTLLEAQQYTAYRGQQRVGLDPEILVVSDPDIEKEQITSYEIGYLGEFPNSGLSIDLKFFIEQLDSIIDESLNHELPGDLIPPAVLRSNSLSVDTRGFELGIDFRPVPIPQLLVAAQFSHIVLDGERVRSFPPANYYPLRGSTPEYTMNLLASYTFPWQIELGANYFKQDQVDWLQGHFIYSFARIDFRLAKTFNIGRTSSLLELIVQNALGDDYQEYHDFNNFERRSYLRFSLDWQ